MFYNKAQREIFNAMLNERTRTSKFVTADGKIFITISGEVGWVFPESVLKIDTEKLRDFTIPNIDDVIAKENELEETIDFVLADERSKTMVRRYRNKRQSVFVNPKLLAHFQNPVLFQKDMPHGIIVVAEKNKGGGHDVCGIVCPVRCKWAERYADYF